MDTINTTPVGQPPIWVTVSASHVGINELPGKLSQAVILQWAQDLGVARIYTNDDLAWCALYGWRVVQACQLPLPAFTDPYDYLRARRFVEWGQVLDYDAVGMFAVFERPGGFHVGIVLGERGAYYWVRGGNQSNMVGHAWIEKARLVRDGRRWPIGVPLPARGLPTLLPNGHGPSTNEA